MAGLIEIGKRLTDVFTQVDRHYSSTDHGKFKMVEGGYVTCLVFMGENVDYCQVFLNTAPYKVFLRNLFSAFCKTC